MRDGEGNSVSENKLSEERPKRKPPKDGEGRGSGGSYAGVDTAPGQTRHSEELLSKDFDLSKPGKYTVQDTEWYGSSAASSNTLIITVVP